MKRKVLWWEVDHELNKHQRGEATLLEFGIGYVDIGEENYVPAHFSTGIIELPDGSIRNIPVENMEFIKPE